MAKVLIGYSACQLTHAAFEGQGHNVWTCDLLPARGNSNKHLMMDVWDALKMDWDFAVFHPMCTYMNVASAWALKDPDYARYPGVGYHQKVKLDTLVGAARRAAQAAGIENFKRLLALPYPVAVENPAPSSLNTAVRPPNQVVHPYQFGDDASKGTGFWLTKGLPPLKVTKYVPPRFVCGCGTTFRKHGTLLIAGTQECPGCDGVYKHLPRWANQTDSGQNRLSPGGNRWLDRSQTYPGIAAAMGDQWGRWLKEQGR